MIYYIESFMKVYTDVEEMVRFFFSNLKSCNVGSTDGRDL
jgi:hypothetical protein